MKYSEAIKQIFRENKEILFKYWWVFLGIAVLYHAYLYLIAKFIPVATSNMENVMFAYHILIYPIMVLTIMYLVDCSNKEQLPVNLAKLVQDAKRCYVRMVLIYLVMGLIRRYLGFGSIIIVFTIMYVKLPFLEQEIFFKNSSLWQSIKKSNELTNNADIIKMITVLVAIFLIIYFGIVKATGFVLNSYFDYKHLILAMLSVLELGFFLFCKAVLTKTYTKFSLQI